MKVYLATGGSYSDYRVYAVFATREAAQAFIDHPDSYADDIEEVEVYERMPGRTRWFVIERMKNDGKVVRRDHVAWDFDGAPYGGFRRRKASYSKWEYGERAFGTDKAAVEKVWQEAHAAEEAAEAGVG